MGGVSALIAATIPATCRCPLCAGQTVSGTRSIVWTRRCVFRSGCSGTRTGRPVGMPTRTSPHNRTVWRFPSVRKTYRQTMRTVNGLVIIHLWFMKGKMRRCDQECKWDISLEGVFLDSEQKSGNVLILELCNSLMCDLIVKFVQKFCSAAVQHLNTNVIIDQK